MSSKQYLRINTYRRELKDAWVNRQRYYHELSSNKRRWPCLYSPPWISYWMKATSVRDLRLGKEVLCRWWNLNSWHSILPMVFCSCVSSFFIEGRFGQHITVKYFKIVKYFRIPQYIHLYHLTTFPYFYLFISLDYSLRICLTILLFTTFTTFLDYRSV